MSLHAQHVIQACTQKLTSINARFQLKESPFYPFPHSYAPALFFSGSKHELRQVVQVCAYKEKYTLQVTLSVFSIALQTANISWLASYISEVNFQLECGYFLFEAAPDKMQLRFILNLQLDRRKTSNEAYLQEVIWKSVKEADERFKSAASILCEKMNKEERWNKQYERTVAALVKMDLKFTLRSQGVKSLIFSFLLSIPSLSDIHTESQSSLSLTEDILTLQSSFCIRGSPAVFPASHDSTLYKVLNFFNEKMPITVLITRNRTVELVFRMFCDDARAEWMVSALIQSFRQQLEAVFPSIEQLYRSDKAKTPHFAHNLVYLPAKSGLFSSYSSNSLIEVFNAQITLEMLNAEHKERDDLHKVLDVIEYLFYEGVVETDEALTIIVPESFTALEEFVKGKIILTVESVDLLGRVMAKLEQSGFQYTKFDTLVYFTGGNSNILFKLLPKLLSLKRVKISNSIYADLMLFLSEQMLKYVHFFALIYTADKIKPLLKVTDGNYIDSEKIRCVEKQCDHSEPGWWRRGHKIGRTRTRLTPIFDIGSLKDFQQISAEFFRNTKYHHPQYQSRAFGFTLMQTADDKTIMLAEEDPTYRSLRDFFTPENSALAASHGESVYVRLCEAVKHLHSYGQTQLLLSPATVGVDIVKGRTGEIIDVRPKLPAIPMLTEENWRDVATYYLRDKEMQTKEYDWARADENSLQLLHEYIVRGIDPHPAAIQTRKYTEIAALKGTDRLAAALRQLL